MDSINDKYYKKTKYDASKQCKEENFRFLNKKYPSDNCTVLVGDSLTEIYNQDFWFEYAKMSGQTVYNRGINGDTSDRMYERLMENVINLKPRNIVIEIGTNDLGLGAPVEFTFCNIEKSINLIKETLPQANIILESVYPVNKSVSLFSTTVGRRDNDTIDELNARLSKLAAAHEITFVDFTEKLSGKNGKLSKELTYDGLHLNAKGFQLITESLIPLLK